MRAFVTSYIVQISWFGYADQTATRNARGSYSTFDTISIKALKGISTTEKLSTSTSSSYRTGFTEMTIKNGVRAFIFLFLSLRTRNHEIILNDNKGRKTDDGPSEKMLPPPYSFMDRWRNL